MADQETVMQWLETCANGCEDGCPYEYKNLVYKVECKADLMSDALELLKEQEPYSSTETRLNRDEYCRVGDVLDCFDGMDLKAEEVFHAVNLIEWAMSKRSIPLQELLEAQEPVKPIKPRGSAS